MKKFSVFCILLLILCTLASCTFTRTVDDIVYTELGIPASSRYSEGNRARNPWDMVVLDGKLYVGSGDYDSNAGPVDIWAYDIAHDTWDISGTVPDEEVFRFCVINNTLVTPGIDPTEDWSYGNYYAWNNGTWEKHRNIPGGMHNFDMVEYQGMMFCGLGVASGKYPIACSADGGKTFSAVKMYKDGALLDTSGSQCVRVPDLFVFGDSLYATFFYGDNELTYDLYRYENDSFVFDNHWTQKIHQVKYNNCIISSKVEYQSTMFFTTGYLYATNDMANFIRVTFPESPNVFDLTVCNDKLYALCGLQQDNGSYRVSVWEHDGGEATNFKELFNFTYEVQPQSIAADGGSFYIGMGNYNARHEKNGMVLRIDYESNN